jgi:hypothetical protein
VTASDDTFQRFIRCIAHSLRFAENGGDVMDVILRLAEVADIDEAEFDPDKKAGVWTDEFIELASKLRAGDQHP